MYIKDIIIQLLGLDQNCLSFYQMICRGIIVYTLGVSLLRIGKRRFLSTPAPLDIVLILMFGSVMSRAITGNTPFFPTLATGIMLIFLHWIFSYLAFYFTSFGFLFKGYPTILVKDGKIEWSAMRKHHISEKDLLSALRRNAKLIDTKEVQLAILERNGEISVIPYPQLPRPISIEVKDGVQKVIVEFSPSNHICKIN